MAPRRTLAEELAELATPRPAAEADFEGDELGNGFALDDEEIDYGDLYAQQPSRKAHEKRDKLRADIQLQEPSYSGRRTSRAAAFGDAASSSSDAPSQDAADSQDSSQEEDEESAADEEDEGSSAADEEDQEASSSSQGAESSNEEEEGSEADEPSPSGKEEQEEEDDEEAELARQYAEAAAQDQIALANMKDRVSKDQAKGLAVLHQKRLWEQNLELRILLQKCLQSANRMPYGASHSVVIKADPTLAASYSQLVSDAATAVDDLLDLHQALVQQHPAAQQSAQSLATNDSNASSKHSKRQRQEEGESEEEGQAARKWQRIDEEYRKFVPFRDASVDRWHRKTMLISGAGAVKGSLRALNQSVSSQVATLMKDPSKLARRTGVATQQRPRVLCQPMETLAEPDPAAELGRGPEQPDGSETIQGGPDGFGAELDLEAFDDGEFYAQLLKEFLDSNSAGSHQAAGALTQGKKKRKNVDRRASKGRKLRYHVQEKLVNFMAPVEQAGHGIATQLFSSLFGSK